MGGFPFWPFDVLVEEFAGTIRLLPSGYKIGVDAVVGYYGSVQDSRNPAGIWIIHSPFVNLTALLLELESLVHYFTFLSLGFLALAEALALRLAFARIAPAEPFETPSFLAILAWTDLKLIFLLFEPEL